jgi:hypothetical protein
MTVPLPFVRIEQVTRREAYPSNDCFPRAAGMAFQEPLAVAMVNAEAILPVLMRRAFGCPAFAAAADAFQTSHKVNHLSSR